jgi:hypothetical protein
LTSKVIDIIETIKEDKDEMMADEMLLNKESMMSSSEKLLNEDEEIFDEFICDTTKMLLEL